jgi:pyruvate/2-oxoglutarate dehydrogenase complex dihydrolipoamide dehydrogenase (E3) component
MGSAPVDYLDNESFWQLRTMPASLVFLGGGVIAAELGQVMARFGCEVTIIDRNPRILKVVDEEVGALATRILQEEGIHIMTEAEVTSCESLPTGRIKLHLERKGESEELEAERIFAALGRIPNTAGLQLERAAVAHDDRRGVITNEYLQTTADNVYACGDITARLKFTHTASYQADVCVENILRGNHVVNDLSVLPWVIYTEPEIAHVGMRMTEARQKVPNHRIFKVDAATVDRFVTEGKTVGFLKILMDENDAVIGADGIGAHSGEWIQIITLAIKHNLPINSITDTIFAYPTFSEVVKKAFSRYLRTRT